MPTLTASINIFNILLEVPASAVRQEKEIKHIQLEGKNHNCHFADDMILCTENSKISTQKLSKLINNFKVTHKSIS